MKGMYHVIVRTNKLHYEFDIKRKITIIQGDSATGKTTLIGLLSLRARLGDSSGVQVMCKKKIMYLTGPEWKMLIENTNDYMMFLDEEEPFLKTDEFARAVKHSNHYFIIVSRDTFPNLPYSVEEIYGIRESGKYHELKRTYNEFYHIYSKEKLTSKVVPHRLVVEDSNSGYEFFKNVCDENNIECISAGGKSNIERLLKKQTHTSTLVIADGAAIGPEMNVLYGYMQKHPNVKLYLPESFEWLILKSGIIDGARVQEILEHPEDYIESGEYFSWEQFFTVLLTEETKDTFLQYAKEKLNEAYLRDDVKEAILKVMDNITWNNHSHEPGSTTET